MIQGRVGCDHAFPNIYEDSFSSFSSPFLLPVLIVCPYSLSRKAILFVLSFIHPSFRSVDLYILSPKPNHALCCGLH